ncbi:hypothetical protein PENSPDRAFT_657079 [Peniophora sp. CONT]|nr:hypothetical protein PENSPDRAFT_657079 [Peniophora sp. CONT]
MPPWLSAFPPDDAPHRSRYKKARPRASTAPALFPRPILLFPLQAMSGPVPAAIDAGSGSSVGHLVTSILSEHEALRAENADLRAQLAVARQHSDPVAAATIADLQQRYDREREHHAATRNALNAMRAAWDEYILHASKVDARMHEARSEVARVMGGSIGYAHFGPPPSPMVPARIAGPARTLPAFPGMPATLPPAPAAVPAHRHHRGDGNDERPAKRQRADRPRHAGDSPMSRPVQYLTGPGADPGYLAAPAPSFAFASGRPGASSSSPKQNHTAELRGRPRSRASTTARSRSRSLSVDDMLLDAAGEAPLPQNATAPTPAPVLMLVDQHRTHVFQPPVTGPPVKRTQTRPVDKASTLGDPAPPPDASAYPPGGFPATNDQGQRICRQCGFRGRYKDGKCVEKWGPGPAGPGTVCDKCRKKIKRVERRGTLDPAALGPHPVSPPPPPHEREAQPERITAAKTLPAHLPPPPSPAQRSSPAARSRAGSASSQQRRARSYSDEDELDVDAEADEDDDLANDLLASIES